MIFSSVGSAHHCKYSYEIHHEYLKGWGNLSGKIFSIKRNHQFNLVSFFFQIEISLLAYVATFSGQLNFERSYFFTLFQNNYFEITVSFSGQLFLQNSCFFLLSQNCHLFAGVISSKQLLFRRETSTEQTLLENRKFFTTVTFRNSYFFRRNCLG